MPGNDRGLTPCFVVLSEPLHVLRDGLTDAGTTASAQALSQLVQLFFELWFDTNPDSH